MFNIHKIIVLQPIRSFHTKNWNYTFELQGLWRNKI